MQIKEKNTEITEVKARKIRREIEEFSYLPR